MPLFGKFFSEAAMRAAVEEYRLWSLMPVVPLHHVYATAGRAAAIDAAKLRSGGVRGLGEVTIMFSQLCDEHQTKHGLKDHGRTDGKGGWKGDDLVRTAHLWCLTTHWRYGANNGTDAALVVVAEQLGVRDHLGTSAALDGTP